MEILNGVLSERCSLSGSLTLVGGLTGSLSANGNLTGSLSDVEGLIGSLSVYDSLTGFLTPEVSLYGELSIPDEAEMEYYDGSYSVIPSQESQTLDTSDLAMRDDVVIEAIPFYLTTNLSGGYTAIIGN